VITNPFPATFHERGYLYAEREHRSWYLIERGEEMGITADLEAGDEVVAVYEA